MLSIRVEGTRVVIDGLNQLAAEMPKAVDRGLVNIAKGVYSDAFKWLSGPGRTSVRLTNRNRVKWSDIETRKTKSRNNKTSRRGQFDSLEARPGSYPVPVQTGNLRRLLDWLKPGESKTGAVGTFTAGKNEVIIYDSAQYARVIHEGRASSAKYGARRFLTDAFARFNSGGKVVQTIETEIQAEIAKAKLK